MSAFRGFVIIGSRELTDYVELSICAHVTLNVSLRQASSFP
jgi:hypothetical protein